MNLLRPMVVSGFLITAVLVTSVGLRAQISQRGYCAIEGPVFWGNVLGFSQVIPQTFRSGWAREGDDEIYIEAVEGHISLDCEDGELVYSQSALVGDPWRGAANVSFDLSGGVRQIRFAEPGDGLTVIGILSISFGSGIEHSVTNLGTTLLWFEIRGVAPEYRELFESN